MLRDIKDYLVQAEQLMKNNVDKLRRNLQFEVGELVFLKLRSYRQNSITERLCKKLSARYYGPFKIIEKIGAVAYRLDLPPSSKIHVDFSCFSTETSFG